MRRVKVFTEMIERMTHMRWKCMQHFNDANPLVAATWSKPLNNFDHARNLPASVITKSSSQCKIIPPCKISETLAYFYETVSAYCLQKQ
jgi:hypothetical protein